MDWNCLQIEERLSDSLESRLTPEEAQAFSAHLAGCPDCRDLVENVRALVRGMESLEMVPEPPGLTRKILDATLGPRKQTSAREGWTRWVPAFLQPRLAMGAVTLAAMALIAFQISGLKFGHLRHAELNPVSVLNNANRQAHLVYAHTARFVSDLRVVYEIESRLQPQPEAEPPIQPPSLPEHPPQGTNPQEKSQSERPRDRSQVLTAALVAELSASPFIRDAWTRSSQ